jgi:hypothetical protein
MAYPALRGDCLVDIRELDGRFAAVAEAALIGV